MFDASDRNLLKLGLLTVGLGLLLLSCSSAPEASSPEASSPEASAAADPIQAVQAPTVQEDLAQVLPISAQIKIAETVIQLEVARTPAEQAMGLMYRPVLPDDRGMLFPFEPPRPVRFWMKNTPQPLDMVFLLDDQVKAVIPNVPPCTSDPCPTYGPGTDVNQVLELRSGRAAELGIKAGDRVVIEFITP